MLSICENYFSVILVLGWILFLCERICGYERELMMMLGDRPSLIFLEMYPVNSGLYRSNFSTEARFYSGIFQKWITPKFIWRWLLKITENVLGCKVWRDLNLIRDLFLYEILWNIYIFFKGLWSVTDIISEIWIKICWF